MASIKNSKINNNPPKISVIIVNHNGGQFLDDALASLQGQQGVDLEIVVVDNASTDDSVKRVKSLFPKVRLIKRHTAVGFAAANNLAVSQTTAPTILFMNPDVVIPNPESLKLCYTKLMSDRKIAILTARVNLALSGKIDETCHRGFPTPWASLTHFLALEKLFPTSPLFAQYTKSYLGYDHEHEIDAVGGMFMLIRREVGDQLGWWDEDFPLYGEDLDLCYRAKQAGYRNWYFPKVMVLHYKGASTGMSKHSRLVTTATKETTKRVKKWSIQAMELFYNKHYAQKSPIFVTWLVKLGIRILYFIRVKI